MNIGEKIRRELTSSGRSFTSFQMVHTHTLSPLPHHSLTHTLTLTHSQAGMGQSPLPQGRMYALRPSGVPLASLWRPSGVPLACLGLRCFCVAGVGQSPLPGVGCTPWRPSGVPWAPLLLRGRRGTISTARGSDVRPGVPLAFLGGRLVLGGRDYRLLLFEYATEVTHKNISVEVQGCVCVHFWV